MNKFILIIIVFVFSVILSCNSSKMFSEGDILDRLFIEQKKISPVMADNFDYCRRIAISKKEYRSLTQSKFDTLWLIERANEVDLSSSIAAWNSNRDFVVIFELDIDGFNIKEIDYNSFKDPLKTITESFDTKVVDSNHDVLGSKKVFISFVSKQSLVTLGF
ncbi:hypothetical protein J2X69_003358 [Algoriphagus sp. 4150]|uniref:hypothetical protein n=1 Tax=Algoriphagus sp. 4150 TaxID=2817756 RepID=UPI002865A0CE|nr:hypothetical protein [Algoriphagus sp. 4150]MDR7130999.1 hypothetical protein [Algoriphagus sp. 4150]